MQSLRIRGIRAIRGCLFCFSENERDPNQSPTVPPLERRPVIDVVRQEIEEERDGEC
jgi:hypothetical protein